MGEIFGFLGPNGAGKTTTQKLIIGLLKTYGGNIEILGKNLRQWNIDIYNKIGVGFELPNHYQKLTALENLSSSASMRSAESLDSESEKWKSQNRRALADPFAEISMIVPGGSSQTSLKRVRSLKKFWKVKYSARPSTSISGASPPWASSPLISDANRMPPPAVSVQ